MKLDIKYGINAVRAVIKATGKTPSEIFQNAFKGDDFEMGTILIWAGLLHQDKNLTIEQVGDWLDTEEGLYIKAVTEAVKKFMEAFNRSFAVNEKNKSGTEKN